MAALAFSNGELLLAVRLDVVLRRLLGVLGGVDMMRMRQMGVVSGFLVMALGMRCRGCVVVARSVLVVLRCLGVMFSCLV